MKRRTCPQVVRRFIDSLPFLVAFFQQHALNSFMSYTSPSPHGMSACEHARQIDTELFFRERAREHAERFAEPLPVVPAPADEHVTSYRQHLAGVAFEAYMATKRTRHSL